MPVAVYHNGLKISKQLCVVIFLLVQTTGAALDGKKCFPLYNLAPKMDAAFQGLITNTGLMAAGMSYSYSLQKQTTSLYVYMTY